MVKDNSLIELDNKTKKIFEDIRDICENFLGDSTLTDIDPDRFIDMIKDKISEYKNEYKKITKGKRQNMKIYTIDFIRPMENSHILNIEGNYISFNSIRVFSKEPFEYDIDIRMTIQAECELDVIKNYNYISDIVESIVRKLFEKYFLDKINKYIFDNRLNFQDELAELLQLEFAEYNFKMRHVQYYFQILKK